MAAGFIPAAFRLQTTAQIEGVNMDITLYHNSSNNKTVNKALSSATNISGHLHTTTNIEYPNLVLSGIYTEFNYCYIPTWRRYYFIEDIIINGNTTLIKCSIDVLYTYRNDILNSYALLNQATEYNPYYDGGFLAESRNSARRFDFNNPFNSEGTIVMVTAAYPFGN